MTKRLERVRGSRRKKIEQAIIDAGYIYHYSTQNYEHRLKVSKGPRIDIVRLANDMKINRPSFTRNFTNKEGMPLYFAKDIISFLNDSYNINLNIKFDDYNE